MAMSLWEGAQDHSHPSPLCGACSLFMQTKMTVNRSFFLTFGQRKKSGLCYTTDVIKDFPGSPSGKESACQCRRRRRCWFDPWFGKIPWRRKWQPTPVLLPGKSYGQSPWPQSLQSTTERSTAHHSSVGLQPCRVRYGFRLPTECYFYIRYSQMHIVLAHLAVFICARLTNLGTELKWRNTELWKDIQAMLLFFSLSTVYRIENLNINIVKALHAPLKGSESSQWIWTTLSTYVLVWRGSAWQIANFWWDSEKVGRKEAMLYSIGNDHRTLSVNPA